jgi:hypothetical protein
VLRYYCDIIKVWTLFDRSPMIVLSWPMVVSPGLEVSPENLAILVGHTATCHNHAKILAQGAALARRTVR